MTVVVHRATIAWLLAAALSGCGLWQHGTAANAPATAARDRKISATSAIDSTHRLSITARLASEGRTPPGVTPLQILVKDAGGTPVRDAIVYVATDSVTGATPKMTLLGDNRDGAYYVSLPLVYGSQWTFTVKAFSSGRSGVLSVVEDLN